MEIVQLDAGELRFLTEVSASIHLCITVHDNKEVPPYLVNHLNFLLVQSENTTYQFHFDSNDLIVDSEHHRIKYTPIVRKTIIFKK